MRNVHPVRATDGLPEWAALLGLLLAWYEKHKVDEEVARNQESGYNLTKYKPKPKGL